MEELEPKTHHQTPTTLHSLYGQKYWDPSLEEKKLLPNCANKDGNIIKIYISTSVATVLKCMK